MSQTSTSGFNAGLQQLIYIHLHNFYVQNSLILKHLQSSTVSCVRLCVCAAELIITGFSIRFFGMTLQPQSQGFSQEHSEMLRFEYVVLLIVHDAQKPLRSSYFMHVSSSNTFKYIILESSDLDPIHWLPTRRLTTICLFGFNVVSAQ